jgi:CheY-like chemotaxis protein
LEVTGDVADVGVEFHAALGGRFFAAAGGGYNIRRQAQMKRPAAVCRLQCVQAQRFGRRRPVISAEIGLDQFCRKLINSRKRGRGVNISRCMSKILIIDDEVAICQVMGAFLRRHGHEVIVANDGKAGLEAALQKPDLIICDLAMPALNGQDVLVALRRDKRLEDIPFIFLSGTANRSEVRHSMNLGGDDFLTKPAEMSEILDAVNSRLVRRQRQQQRQEEEVKKAVQIFSGIVNDMGSPEAAIHWLAEVAASDRALPPVEKTGLTPPAVPPVAPSFLATKDNRRYFVKLSEVKALLADGEYSRAFWGKDQHMMFRKPLKQWEAELPASQFVRIHRKAIINLSFLDFVDNSRSGNPQVHLKEFKDAIEVSQRKVPVLNRSLKGLRHV